MKKLILVTFLAFVEKSFRRNVVFRIWYVAGFPLPARTLVQADPNEGVWGEAVKEIKVYAGEYYKGDDYNEDQQHKLFFLKKLFRTLYRRVRVERHCNVVGEEQEYKRHAQ